MISGTAKIAGVIGWPVHHSLSPRLHGYWLKHYDIDGAYIPLPVKPQDLAAVLSALPRMGFAGVNLTLPHKEAVMTIADELDPAAQRSGAANTLVFGPNGEIFGHNTDGLGFLAHLAQSAPQFDLKAGPALVLGAGGAARAVIAALLEAGCPSISLTNRTQSRAEALAQQLTGPIEIVPWQERSRALADATLLINTTSLGMSGQQSLSLDLDLLASSTLVADIVYNPLETPLLAAARRRGNATLDGLGMLLHQAVFGFEAWFGQRPQVSTALRDHILEVL